MKRSVLDAEIDAALALCERRGAKPPPEAIVEDAARRCVPLRDLPKLAAGA